MTDGFVSTNLADLTAPDVRRYLETRKTVLIPLGSHEQHGQHLPLGTDVITAMSVVQRVSERTGVLHVPPVWMGYSPSACTNPMRAAALVTVRASTYLALINDLGRSLVHQGFERLIFVNGHGGNNVIIDPVLREIRYSTGALVVFVHAIIDGGINVGIFDGILTNAPHEMPGGHSSELETSQVLAWNPDLVHLERAVPTAAQAPAHLPASFAHTDGRSGIAFEQQGYIRSPLDYSDISETGGPGNATTATAEKGAAALDRLADHIARGVLELESVPVTIRARSSRGAHCDGHRGNVSL